jgi:hypothetical protein
MTMISESEMLSELAAEFPGYEFSTQQTWEGVSLIAVRQDGSARSGPCVVITPDLDEMRRALLENTVPQNTVPQNTGPESTGPESTGPEKMGQESGPS